MANIYLPSPESSVTELYHGGPLLVFLLADVSCRPRVSPCSSDSSRRSSTRIICDKSLSICPRIICLNADVSCRPRVSPCSSDSSRRSSRNSNTSERPRSGAGGGTPSTGAGSHLGKQTRRHTDRLTGEII